MSANRQHTWSVSGPRWLPLLMLVLWLGLAAPLSARAASSASLGKQAVALENRQEWLEACQLYDEILHRDRDDKQARAGYQRCLRRLHLVRRHRDPLYRQAVGRLSTQQALDLYEQVLYTVSAVYVDRNRSRVNDLFRHGVRELEYALDEPVFRREYLASVSEGSLAEFRSHLRAWRDQPVNSRSEARAQVLAIIKTAQQDGLVTQPSFRVVLALELASGACNALDEYTLFLTPGYHTEVQDTLHGKLVSVGIDLALPADNGDMAGQRGLEIVRVYPNGPADLAGVLRHDRLLRIDRQSADRLLPADAAERLRGAADSTVEIEVITPGQMMSRTIKLGRRALVVPSVDFEPLYLYSSDSTETVPVGVIRITSFQESTLQEMKEALLSLQSGGMRGLILDLRGNPGGYFKSAVQVAEMFMGEGTIVISHSQLREYNRPFKADSSNPVQVPMVVLIDGDTASAAEVLAGALKEQRRATLVGQTTFGKGSIQAIVPLDRLPLERSPSGIRITVAKLYSPSRHPYSGKGVTPDVVFDPEDREFQKEASRILLGMLKPIGPMTLPR
jgi:carboxyl-terminal processing protease